VGRLHVGEWAAELAGTAVQLGLGFPVVGLVGDPRSPLAIHDADARLALIGLTFGALAGVVAVSPVGRRSGAHLNPAVTLAFWLRGQLHPRDLAGYAAAQTAGALVATGAFVAAWGGHARAVGDAVTMPARSVGALGGVAIEAALTASLLVVLFGCLSSPRTARFTPLAAVGALTVLIWAGARLTGASLNPARSLAPALVAGRFDALWVYFAGPALGATVAALAFGAMAPRAPLTVKLCGSG
jgi:aquaporin Z